MLLKFKIERLFIQMIGLLDYWNYIWIWPIRLKTFVLRLLRQLFGNLGNKCRIHFTFALNFLKQHANIDLIQNYTKLGYIEGKRSPYPLCLGALSMKYYACLHSCHYVQSNVHCISQQLKFYWNKYLPGTTF